MGRYSDSDDDYRRSKKKKRRISRSRSRSRSSSGESKSSRRKKSKKSKHKKKSSRSVTPLSDRSYKSKRRSRSRDRRSKSRSRSRSRSRSYSKSYSRRSRSKSHSRYRSRSPSPLKSRSRYSRSRSRSRGSHSRSRRRSRSRSKSPWPPRGRSWSRSPRRSRSRSRGPRSKRTSRSLSPDRTDSKKEETPIDPCSLVPGFAEMSTSKQAEIRLQMALKAAAAADEKLKQQGVIPQSTKSNISLTIDEQTRRTKAIEEIEDEGFAQMPFKSTKYEPMDGGPLNIHDEVIFGTFDITSLIMKKEPTRANSSKSGESIMHPNLHVPQAEKMERWRKKLIYMRRKKLEGELMI